MICANSPEGSLYQFIRYERQIRMKEEIIRDCMRRIGKIDSLPFADALFAEPWRYRRRAQFKVVGGIIGFYRENTHSVVPFTECLLLSDELNHNYRRLQESGIPPGVKEILATSGNSVIGHIRGVNVDAGYLRSLVEDRIFGGVTSDNGDTEGVIDTEFLLGNIRFAVSPRSFLQSNWNLNVRLVSLVIQTVQDCFPAAGPAKDRSLRLIDLYGGSGNFSLPLADMCHDIQVVEENTYAISDGTATAERNAIRNGKFIHSPAENFRFSKHPDIIIVDPPRAGLTTRTVHKIMEAAPDLLLYISCNPATLARDL